ncbi:ATP-binding protein [Streptomyces sp. NPDC059175]|uniref:ATP-binding protein n=1 Tax=unclassified Streptomyces TaxID=2593676 RepID=UPI003682071E
MKGTRRNPKRALPSSPAQARKRVEVLLHDRPSPLPGPCGETSLSDALLVTSELVTNAFRHGGGVTDFAAEVTDSEVRVSVGDRSDRLPELPNRTEGRDRVRIGGFGWRLILTLARNVAITRRDHGGKLITALVPLG